MFRFAQRLSQIFTDLSSAKMGELNRFELELEDAISSPTVQYSETWTVQAGTNIKFETLTSTSIPVYISTPKVNPANPPAGSIVFYLDELGNALHVNVTYSDGVTTKDGSIALT